VDRHAIKSPDSELMALTTIVPPEITTRGPRCRPSDIFGKSATFAGGPNVRPLSSDRASQIPSPDPNTIATIPLPAASWGCRLGPVATGPTDKTSIIAKLTIPLV
jgi:hypothetical protein